MNSPRISHLRLRAGTSTQVGKDLLRELQSLNPDEVFAEAIRAATTDIPPRTMKSGAPARWPDERRQVRAELQRGLILAGVPETAICWERECPETDWDPPPGGLDLYVFADGVHRPFWLIVELKLEEVGQTLWDLFRLTDGFSEAPLDGGRYLWIAASQHAWTRTASCCELFPGHEGEARDHNVNDLFRDNEAVFRAQLKRDWPKKPVRVPTRVRTRTLVAGEKLDHYPHLEVRAVSVEVTDRTPIELEDGLPEFLRR